MLWWGKGETQLCQRMTLCKGQADGCCPRLHKLLLAQGKGLQSPWPKGTQGVLEDSSGRKVLDPPPQQWGEASAQCQAPLPFTQLPPCISKFQYSSHISLEERSERGVTAVLTR